MVLSSCIPWLKLTSQLNPAWSLRIDLAQLEITKQWLVLQLLVFFFFYYLYIIYCRHLHCSCAHLHLFRAQTGRFCLPVFTASARNAAGSAWASRLAPVTADFQGSSGAAVRGAAPLQQSVWEKLHGRMLCPALGAAFAFSLTLFKEILSTSLVFQYAYTSLLFFFKHSEQVIPILHPVLHPEG